VRRSTFGISLRILLYGDSMAYHDVICVLTSGIALYMHFTAAYAASRASVVPAIATDTCHVYSSASLKHLSYHRGIRDRLSHMKHQLHATSCCPFDRRECMQPARQQ
jgi:hypothetical protein